MHTSSQSTSVLNRHAAHNTVRPGELGSVLTKAGDIDNRLKSLFDALGVPDVGQIPRGDTPRSGETPFFCLLDDDALVTEVDVVTDRLLEPTDNENVVELIIAVSIRSSRKQWVLCGGQYECGAVVGQIPQSKGLTTGLTLEARGV